MTPPSSSAASRPAGALPKSARPDRQALPPPRVPDLPRDIPQDLGPGEALARAVAMERRAPEKARLIKASEDLRRRAVNQHRGHELVLDDELRRRMEKVISDACPSFEQDILYRLAETRLKLAGLKGDSFAMVFLLPELHDLAVDIKGMGGTFGYHLLTDLAKSLEDLLAQVELPTTGECDLIAIHVDAMHMLLAQRIRGQGGDLERQLLINLGYAADKVTGEDSPA